MKKVQCKEGLDIYKKFLTRMTRISEFLKVAEVTFSCLTVVEKIVKVVHCCNAAVFFFSPLTAGGD